jgi:hypothetical protein
VAEPITFCGQVFLDERALMLPPTRNCWAPPPRKNPPDSTSQSRPLRWRILRRGAGFAPFRVPNSLPKSLFGSDLFLTLEVPTKSEGGTIATWSSRDSPAGAQLFAGISDAVKRSARRGSLAWYEEIEEQSDKLTKLLYDLHQQGKV